MINIQYYQRPAINLFPTFHPVKKVKDKTKIDVRYAVIPPFAFVHIYWDPKIYEVIYEVEEPILDPVEIKYKEQIINAMKDMIDYDTIVEKDTEKLLDGDCYIVYNNSFILSIVYKFERIDPVET